MNERIAKLGGEALCGAVVFTLGRVAILFYREF
jgi:hypothetical protein